MAALGVSLAGAEVTLWVTVPAQHESITHYFDAEAFRQLGAQAPIKRVGGKFG